MSLSAVLLVKVLRDLPARHARGVLSLGALAAGGYLATEPVYAAEPWLGQLTLLAASLLASAALVTVLWGYVGDGARR